MEREASPFSFKDEENVGFTLWSVWESTPPVFPPVFGWSSGTCLLVDQKRCSVSVSGEATFCEQPTLEFRSNGERFYKRVIEFDLL